MRTIIIFLLFFIEQFLYGQEPINIRAPLRQVYGGDTCLTYFNGDTTILECPTQTYYKIGTSLNVAGDLYVNGEILNDLITNTIIIYGDTSTTAVNLSDSSNYSHFSGYAYKSDSTFEAITVGTGGNTTGISSAGISTNNGLTVSGVSNLGGIQFTGSTPTLGAFYTGTTFPTGTSRANWRGYLYATKFIASAGRFGDGGTLNPAALNEFIYNSGSYGGIFQLENASVVPFSIIHTGAITEGNTSNFLSLTRDYSGNFNSTGNIINIVDNPTTSGTISGKILSATVGSTERISLNPRVSDGASATAYFYDTHNNLTSSGAYIAKWYNNGVLMGGLWRGGYFESNGIRSLDQTSALVLSSSSLQLATNGYDNISISNLGAISYVSNVSGGSLAHLFNTQNDITTGILLDVRNQGTSKFKVKKDSVIVPTVLKIGSGSNIIETTTDGDLKYQLSHGTMYINAATYTPNVTQNVAFKLVPGLTVQDSDYLTMQGDSVTFTRAGDYQVSAAITINGSVSTDWRFSCYKNGAPQTSMPVITTTGAGNYMNVSWFWYIQAAVNDDVSFRLTNLSNNNDPTLRNMVVYVVKQAEEN